ncbi:helix-turn-helix domain-containing protein [Sphingobacterium paramultivorum]|uniref:Transcriptional regulator n=2 Tax=Sphingobacterium TaxID=28453 RepID=A0A420FPH1_9SPHI|nr:MULTISPECIES: response regulator transcription factor [Sphingobacterium]MCS4168028.1 AraC-like DNA-binding protein [Sphingobacterium sp. BIGb0116]QMV68073.1 helix-turn-helix domain-containing protein [Sphingobacterium paramultivorum]QRY56435.1 helix-turn-helix domain-containing protein [Sphingobacterium siyangense]RKF34753.1 transcriptional regulator [Sphingobacterium siyangense]WSO16979.1 helix-turn-helix transcriptional regulator [Sphingobacterium paramultivorum]
METKIVRSVSEFNSELRLQGFKAFQIEDDSNATRVYSRKDFFKICLTTGKSKIHYADKSFEQEGTILFFGNPHIPYSWETISTTYAGYTCLFSEDFLKQADRAESLQQSPFFKIGGTPVLKITEDQRLFLNTLFEKMIEEQKSDYTFKDELIRNYINLIIHEALKLQPSEVYTPTKNGTARIASVFLELLERQFPIETPTSPLKMRTAQDYAQNLNIHVNYLNRAVKEITGKSTTTLISERILTEAKALLQHTDWNISEVASALGFEYPTYFNNFFKKLTGTNPKSLRESEI